MSNSISLHEKHMESKLSQLGAKIAQATEYSEQAANLCAESQSLLVAAQSELSEIYETLGDVKPAVQGKELARRPALKLK